MDHAIKSQPPYSPHLATAESLSKTEDTDEIKASCYDWGDKRKMETGAIGHTKKRVLIMFWRLEKKLLSRGQDISYIHT